MKKQLLIIFVIFIAIACSKNKYEFNNINCDLRDGNIRYNETITGSDTIKGISGIIKSNCSYSPCHSHPPADSTLTYDYTIYDGVKRAAGSIYDRINRPVEDPLHMPKFSELTTCEKAKLNVWIINGAPE